MGGTYSDDAVEFLFFGPDGAAVHDAAERARRHCASKGLETDGPIPLPQVHIDPADPAFTGDGVLFGQQPSPEECRVLPGATVSRHLVRAYNTTGRVVEAVASAVPEDVFLRVVLDTRAHAKGGKGTPHTYDPSLDYRTDP